MTIDKSSALRYFSKVARASRIEYPGVQCHVSCCGSERAIICLDDKDKKIFLKALEEAVKAFIVEVQCYALMSNRLHFLLKTREADLSRFMHRVNTAYIGHHNLHHHRSGHLYQGRNKAILVEADGYLLELSLHLHHPVRLKKHRNTWVQKKAEILENHGAVCLDIST